MLQASSSEHHKGVVIWLTGLSGAGKTTLARALELEMSRECFVACVVDGDDVRNGLSSDLGFSEQDRAENNRRVAEVAKLLARAGMTVIVALISPYRNDRSRARTIVTESGAAFFEVFVDTPLAICEERDAKGHYKRARLRQIQEFTGVDAPYEEPLSPDILIHPAKETVATSVATVMRIVSSRKGPAEACDARVILATP